VGIVGKVSYGPSRLRFISGKLIEIYEMKACFEIDILVVHGKFIPRHAAPL
jgi:hypothetical protein